MKKVIAELNLKLSITDWDKFVQSTLWLAENQGGDEISLSRGCLRLRRISPVPRFQYLEILFRRDGAEVQIDSAEMISVDDSAIPYSAESLESDVREMIDESVKLNLGADT